MPGLLLEHSGNRTRVARELGISRPTLYKRLHQLGVSPECYIERWREELDIHGKKLERAREEATTPGPANGGPGIALLPFFLARRLKHVAADRELVEEIRVAHERWAEASHVEPASAPRPPRPRARRALGHDAPDPQVEGNGAATAARRADSKGRELGRREGGPEEDAGAPFGNRSPGRLPPIRRSSPTGPPSERVPTSDAARAHPARDISGRSPPG